MVTVVTFAHEQILTRELLILREFKYFNSKDQSFGLAVGQLPSSSKDINVMIYSHYHTIVSDAHSLFIVHFLDGVIACHQEIYVCGFPEQEMIMEVRFFNKHLESVVHHCFHL